MNGNRPIYIVFGIVLTAMIGLSTYSVRQYSAVLDSVAQSERNVHVHLDALEKREYGTESQIAGRVVAVEGLVRADEAHREDFNIFRKTVSDVIMSHIQDHPHGRTKSAPDRGRE